MRPYFSILLLVVTTLTFSVKAALAMPMMINMSEHADMIEHCDEQGDMMSHTMTAHNSGDSVPSECQSQCDLMNLNTLTVFTQQLKLKAQNQFSVRYYSIDLILPYYYPNRLYRPPYRRSYL